jgi:hypothetical protein
MENVPFPKLSLTSPEVARGTAGLAGQANEVCGIQRSHRPPYELRSVTSTEVIGNF